MGTSGTDGLTSEHHLLRSALDLAPVGVFVTDAATGSIVYWNPAAAELVGATAESYAGEPASRKPGGWQVLRVDRSEFPGPERPMARAILLGETTREQPMIVRSMAGKERSVVATGGPIRNAHGDVVAGVVVLRDATALREAEGLAHRLMQMAEQSTDFIGMTNVEGTVEYVNPAGLRMCGMAEDTEFSALSMRDFHPPEEAARIVQDGIPTAIREGAWTGEMLIKGIDGAIIPVHHVVVAHRDDGGAVTGVTGVMRDLRPVRELQARVAEGMRLESIGRLAGGIAHDFNNLLLIIDHYTRDAVETLPESSTRSDLQVVLDAAKQAAGLCRKLLSVARRQTVAPEPLLLSELLMDRDAYQRQLPDEIELKVSVPKGLWPILSDRGQVEQILSNLVANAREALPAGGEISLKVENAVLSGNRLAALPGLSVGPHVVLTVTDSGEGMTEETRRRAFEPFFTTKGQASIGLGLAMVHGAVHQSGGSVAIRSSPGAGTTVTLAWPRCDQQPEASETAAPEATPVTARILVVDDQPMVRRVTAKMLRAAGFEVEEAASGPEALSVATQGVDLVVTDVVMPEMRGPELVRRLRVERPDLPVVFVSGYHEEDLELGSANQQTAFVAKPFTRARLLNQIEVLLLPS